MPSSNAGLFLLELIVDAITKRTTEGYPAGRYQEVL